MTQGTRAPRRTTPRTILRLGRVSNLPTVWTNALAGAVLATGAGAGAGVPVAPLLVAALALTLSYVGGMWLNDAFDAEIDAAERGTRPIPSGEIGRGTVFVVGGALLLLGVGLAATFGAAPALAGVALAGAIVLYDWVHKRTELAPLVMGVTRLLCYALAALAVAGALPGAVLLGAAGLMAYVVGLTYAARQEAYDRLERAWPLAVLAAPLVVALLMSSGGLWALLLCAALAGLMAFALRLLLRRGRGDVPRAVVTLIAGISLYDAALIAGAGALGWALLAVAAFGLTLLLQKVVPGT